MSNAAFPEGALPQDDPNPEGEDVDPDFAVDEDVPETSESDEDVAEI